MTVKQCFLEYLQYTLRRCNRNNDRNNYITFFMSHKNTISSKLNYII